MYSHTLATLLILLFAANAVSQTLAVKPDPPKGNDATRIGLVTPRVSLLGGGSVPQETASLRQNISSFLTGPRIGTVDLRAKLDSLAEEEGKERGCDYVLFVSLIRKRQGAVRGSTLSGGGTKAGDEFTFEYKVVSTDGTRAPVEKTLKATASADGEDVLTPMIETMAQVVVELARVAKPSRPASNVNAEAKVKAEPNATPQPESAPAKARDEPTPKGYGSLTAAPKGTAPTRNSDPPKAEGTIRIGLVTTRMNLAGGGMSGTNEAASLRKMLSSYLGGSTIETIDLKARLEALALNEGQRRECDFVLYTMLQRKGSSSSKGAGSLNSVMGNVSSGSGSKLPGSRQVRDVSSEAAKVSGTIAALARANDEITFEYKLVTKGGEPVISKLTKAKVKRDGEDVLTPMIESAAQAIVNATVKN